MSTDLPPPAAPRLYFLDWLRAAAFGLLILYHVGMYYVSWDWHIKSPHAGDTIEPLMRLSSPWRLALLFLISGAAMSMLLARRPAGFVRERSKRLLLPLALGMLVIVPPQAYLEVVHKVNYGGSYLDFMRLYLSGYGGFCRNVDCLILPTWNHLWFVAYLWVYCVALWALLKAWPSLLERLAARIDRQLGGWGMLLWPAALLALWRVLLAPRFPTTHALVDDVYSHALYFSVFLAGAVLARWGRWAAFERWRWIALAVALALWGLLAAYFAHYAGNLAPPEWLRPLQRVGYGTLQWLALVAAIGFAHRHWNHDHRWRATVVEAVFPVYLLHQTLIILAAWWLRPLGLSPAVEAPLLIAATAAGCVGGYLIVRRIGPLRVWFGLGWPTLQQAAAFDGQAASSRVTRAT
ncbi:acyltransferase family protein [Aquincola sp. S2]|uniref:Acyltransferase family protein n=1 Tax=Pseudaquabacterium terrae TaxID=2732868 RepID=A0ABX2EBP3_9BURK|nr:acyltransferase family protein [Aquabacterium terrae]NRF66544.1 acyltransferase family protein [Aquabacterium terrae]